MQVIIYSGQKNSVDIFNAWIVLEVAFIPVDTSIPTRNLQIGRLTTNMGRARRVVGNTWWVSAGNPSSCPVSSHPREVWLILHSLGGGVCKIRPCVAVWRLNVLPVIICYNPVVICLWFNLRLCQFEIKYMEISSSLFLKSTLYQQLGYLCSSIWDYLGSTMHENEQVSKWFLEEPQVYKFHV